MPPEVTEIVSGGAYGPDTDAIDFAIAMQLPWKRMEAKWKEHGKKAGILRNIEMAHYADSLLAFWDGESKGTKHMMDYMFHLGKPVKTILIQELDNN